MKIRSMQFNGRCNGCSRGRTVKSPAVLLDVSGDEEAWICTSCARRIARRLVKAADDAQKRTARGLIFRRDTWQRGPRSKKSTASTTTTK